MKNCKQKCEVVSSSFAIHNGIVCKLKGNYHAPVVPTSANELKKLLMLEAHASGLGGHLGVAKMYNNLNPKFCCQHLR